LIYDYCARNGSNEVHQLAKWIQNYLNEAWDQQIEEDLRSGKLDNLIARAEADIAANNLKELDEILHNN
jgi:hypothetical protein